MIEINGWKRDLKFNALWLVGTVTILSTAVFAEKPRVPVFPSKIEMVAVDAVVVDGEGRPIRGLTRDDFVLIEDGVTQEIAAFEAIEDAQAGDVQSKPDDVTRLGRRLVVVFDEAHLSPEGAEEAKSAIERLVESELRDGDEISLVSTDKGSWWEARMPEDRADALAVMKRLRGRPELAMLHRLSEHEAARILAEGRPFDENMRRGGSMSEQTPSALEEAKNATGSATPALTRERVKRRFTNEGLCDLNCDAQIDAIAEEVLKGSARRTRRTLAAFRQAVELLDTHRGRKALVLVSEGFGRNPDVAGEIDQALDAAHRANVAVYFLDMGALTSSPLSLAERNRNPASPDDAAAEMMDGAMTASSAVILAEETGGFSLRNSGDVEADMERIAREAGNYYLMGYHPQRSGKRKRKLKIEVRREGALVRARKTFVAGEEQDATSTSRHDPIAGSGALTAREHLGLNMDAFVMEEHSPGNALILLASSIEPNATKGKIDLRAEVTNRDTGEVFEFEKTLSPKRPDIGDLPIVQFYLPQGIYQSRIVVREKNGSIRDHATRRFEIPRVDAWRVTTPVLTDLIDDGHPVLVARRAFSRDSLIYFQIQVLGRKKDCRSSVTSGYMLFGPDGKLMRWSKPTPIAPDSNGRITRMVGLTLEGYPVGKYNLVLVVEDEAAGQTRELHQSFTVI